MIEHADADALEQPIVVGQRRSTASLKSKLLSRISQRTRSCTIKDDCAAEETQRIAFGRHLQSGGSDGIACERRRDIPGQDGGGKLRAEFPGGVSGVRGHWIDRLEMLLRGVRVGFSGARACEPLDRCGKVSGNARVDGKVGVSRHRGGWIVRFAIRFSRVGMLFSHQDMKRRPLAADMPAPIRGS